MGKATFGAYSKCGLICVTAAMERIICGGWLRGGEIVSLCSSPMTSQLKKLKALTGAMQFIVILYWMQQSNVSPRRRHWQHWLDG